MEQIFLEVNGVVQPTPYQSSADAMKALHNLEAQGIQIYDFNIRYIDPDREPLFGSSTPPRQASPFEAWEFIKLIFYVYIIKGILFSISEVIEWFQDVFE